MVVLFHDDKTQARGRKEVTPARAEAGPRAQLLPVVSLPSPRTLLGQLDSAS